MMRLLFCLVGLTLVSGCVVAPLPIEEYTLARAAVSAAKDAGAERLASGLWFRADESYRKGRSYLADRDNESARQSFLRAIDFAEKAENASRLKKFETGETFE